MAVKTIAELRTYFETGDKPTQQNFWDFLDSYIHKSTGIAMADIAGLVPALTAKVDIVSFLGSRMLIADSVEDLSLISYRDAKFVIVKDVGIFAAYPIDGGFDSLYETSDEGYVWVLMLSAGSLPPGGSVGEVIVKTEEGSGWGVAPTPSELISAITDFATFNKTTVDIITVADEIRGGVFNKYAGALLADGGVIFVDANGTKWKRVLDGKINVSWFLGAAGTDVTPLWNTIMKSATDNKVSKIYFPQRTGNYVFSNEIHIDRTLDIYGDGPLTTLAFPANSSGIVADYINSRRSKISNIVLTGGTSSNGGVPFATNWDNTKHGLIVKDTIICDNVTIRYFAGNAFHLFGSVSDGSNVNNCIFNFCYASQNRLHGFYAQGSDANAIQFTKCDSTANGGVGFYDKSFLGNTYLNCHASANGGPEIIWSRGLVKYNGVVYVSKVDNNIGIEPGVTVGWANSWYNGSEHQGWAAGFANVKTWDAAVTYQVVGGYHFVGAVQYSYCFGIYGESDQPSSVYAGSTMLIGSNTTNRVASARLAAGFGTLYTDGTFYSGNPGQATSKSIMAPTGFQIQTGTKKISLTVDASGDIATLLPTNMALRIQTPGFNFGYTSSFITNRSIYANFDVGCLKPTGTPTALGGIVFHGAMYRPNTLEDFPEVISYKSTQPDSNGTHTNIKWFRVVGEFEWELATTGGRVDLHSFVGNTNKVFKLIVRAVATEPSTGDIYSFDRIYLFKGGLPPTLISMTDLTPEYIDAGLFGIGGGADISGNTIYLSITGLVGKTINWKFRVNRTFVN